MIAIATYREIRTTIDKGEPAKGLAMINALLKGEVTKDERETLAILMGKASKVREAHADNATEYESIALWENGFKAEAWAQARGC